MEEANILHLDPYATVPCLRSLRWMLVEVANGRSENESSAVLPEEPFIELGTLLHICIICLSTFKCGESANSSLRLSHDLALSSKQKACVCILNEVSSLGKNNLAENH
ncbi:hypothetical protein DPMN_045568 [Dreissena polymorpha]|uniref:Uncharacterized protein n=1 Tax=Dreissena polymorpha TaxID=45954 RepID=A0A9D4HXH3_DREPO|nr:hypothetical protein DPMN_045568 [Dreissena polymorpha]